MSSSSALGRTRSLRRPEATNRTGDSGGLGLQKEQVTRNEARDVSPSRLPTSRPTTRSTAAATTNSISANVARNASVSTRPPVSGRALSSTVYSTHKPVASSSSSRAAPQESAASAANVRPLGRAPSTRQAAVAQSSSSITSSRSTSTSTARPKSSGGPPVSASTISTSRSRPPGRSRAKSTVTTLTAATTLRPFSEASSATTSTTSSTPTNTTTNPATTKPQTRPQTHARTLPHPQPAHQLQPPPPPPPSSPKHTTASQPSFAHHQHRPAFNTHQQHYSPAKSLRPKPLTSSFLAPPSPSKLPSNIAISAETSRLQTELLQLSLIHRDAAAVEAEWHESARRKLGARFARLARKNEALIKEERESVERENVRAFLQWGDGTASDEVSREANKGNGRGNLPGLEDKIQRLDQVLNAVWSLSDPGGRYQRIARGFGRWIEQAEVILNAQRQSVDVASTLSLLPHRKEEGGREEEDGGFVFLSELDRAWKADCESLARKLAACRRVLEDDLGATGDRDHKDDDGEPVSGIMRTLAGARSLVGDMLAELAVMEEIEREATSAEDEWIDRMMMMDGDENNDTQRRHRGEEFVPVWRELAV